MLVVEMSCGFLEKELLGCKVFCGKCRVSNRVVNLGRLFLLFMID